jgi:hypothetical protein
LWRYHRAVPPVATVLPTDSTLELAKVVGAAIAASTVDREELSDIACRILDGHERMAQRLGFAVAGALLDALQAAPRPITTSDVPA